MGTNGGEWKDWAWIKATFRARPILSLTAVAWLVSGLVPLVPIWITKGGEDRFHAGRLPPFLLYLDPVGWWPDLALHALESGLVGLGSWHL